MGNPLYWICGALLFGIISAGFYTWMSPRKSGWKRLFLRSLMAYSAIGIVIVRILFIVSKE